METRSIKNVDEETWKKFKTMADKNNINMSDLLKIMIKKFEKESEKFWNEILNGQKNLSEDEAEKMMGIVRESRKEYGFRE